MDEIFFTIFTLVLDNFKKSFQESFHILPYWILRHRFISVRVLCYELRAPISLWMSAINSRHCNQKTINLNFLFRSILSYSIFTNNQYPLLFFHSIKFSVYKFLEDSILFFIWASLIGKIILCFISCTSNRLCKVNSIMFYIFINVFIVVWWYKRRSL